MYTLAETCATLNLHSIDHGATTNEHVHPPHPGDFIHSVYLEPSNISGRTLAGHLGVTASTISRLLKTESAVTPEMALRLSKVLGRTPESWLNMQDNYDLWNTRNQIDLSNLEPLVVGIGKLELTPQFLPR